MIPPKMTSPGEMLLKEFLVPMCITSGDLARHIGKKTKEIENIIENKSKITPEIAWLLSQAFGTSPELWMNLQTNYDLSIHRPKKKIGKLI